MADKDQMAICAQRPVSLSLHKNTVERRRKRELAKELQRNAEAMVREQDIRAYAIVGIAADGKAYCLWDTGAAVPMWCFPEMVAACLRADIDNAKADGVEDDWRPALRP